MRSARLVAEALRTVPDATATVLPAVRPATTALVQALATGATSPARSPLDPPAFLRPTQIDPWRRAMAALDAWHGAIVAEPVGSGKTWIALGVVSSRGGQATVVGPAGLRDQWLSAARRAGVTVRYHAFERASRGHVPPAARLVVIDEAHRLRNPATRRTGVLAPWLTGRETLLLTATPVVNRRRDLLTLLALLVPDDALWLDGIASLRDLAASPAPPRALRRLVIRSPRHGDVPPVAERRLPLTAAERERGAKVVERVNRLQLSHDTGVRALLRLILLDAGASSDAAWQGQLRRYRDLLLQCRDAGGASRASLRQFLGTALDQLVLWPMLGALDRSVSPPLADLEFVHEALREAPADAAWMDGIARRVGRGPATICFCRHRATALALRRHLGAGTAWIMGDAAGIGTHGVAREAIVELFGPRAASAPGVPGRPRVLVTTEVLAEGLDLQGASRVVHVDLPWHAVRLEQRVGRVRRIGQLAGRVEVWHRRTAPAIERELAMHRRVTIKRRAGDRWLTALEGEVAEPVAPPAAVWLAVRSAPRARPAQVWLSLDAGPRHGARQFVVRHGTTIEVAPSPPLLAGEPIEPGEADRRDARRCAAAALRAALRRQATAAAGRHELIAGLLALARTAMVRRDMDRLAHLDAWLAVATRPGPLGLEWQLRALPTLPPADLLRLPVPPIVPDPLPRLRWALVVLHRRGPTRLP